MKTTLLRLIAVAFLAAVFGNSSLFGQEPASFDSVVASYKATANEIIAAGRKSNDSYLKLQELCDDIGARLSGSASLDKAIEWAQESLKNDGHENVRS